MMTWIIITSLFKVAIIGLFAYAISETSKDIINLDKKRKNGRN